MDSILNKLKDGIIEKHTSDFKFKLDEVISMGESPIEKLMLLQLFNYFQKYGKIEINDEFSDFFNLEFIEEEICLWDIDEPLSSNEKVMLEEKIKRFNYRYNKIKGTYDKFIGFKCSINKFEGTSMKSDGKLISREIIVMPQYYETIDQNNYRIDIAFILNRRSWFDNDKIIDVKKVAIECDGYDYHSSPNQKRQDDIRTRKLKKGGWKEVLRYSGSEIFRINDNLELIHHNFEELMEIILL